MLGCVVAWGWLLLAVAADCPQGSSIVSIQLKWLQQTQFAGYFAAQELGFYDEECLTVNIRPGGPAIIIEDEILQGRAQFGIHWAAMTMLALKQKKNVTIVAQVFQRPGMSMVSWKAANINNIADFRGKRVCMWMGGNEGNLRAAFVEHNLTWDSDDRKGFTNPPNNPVDIEAQGFSMEAFLSRECDVAAVTPYNEYAQLLLTQKQPGVLIAPDDITVMKYDKAMLEDSIIASTEWLEDPVNQNITIGFLRASFRGWLWARDNPTKTVSLFADKGPLQTWQLNEVNRLMWPAPLGIGVVDPAVLQQSAEIAYAFNLTNRLRDVDEFYRTDLALAAHQGLDPAALHGLSFQPLPLAFCLSSHDDPELCDNSREADTSFVDAGSSTGVVIIVATLLGLLFSVFCLALLIKWRHERVIKSASLPFSVLMCIGAILGLFSNFFLLERPTDGVCHVRAWLMGLGFVTFIGNFLVKVWRIHVIFNAKVLLKLKISDTKLLFYFSALFGIQVIILGLYSGMGNPQVERVAHTNDYSLYDTVCVTNQANLFNLLFTIYSGVLLVYGVYLAIQVRNLVSLFNEAKLLGGSIYNMIFVAAICGPILLFLNITPSASALIRALASVAMFTGSLAIVFVPKFCLVTNKTEGDGTVSRSGQEGASSHFSSIHIDMESLKMQDSAQLSSHRDKAQALIKAIDAELEKRSRQSGLNSSFVKTSFVNTSAANTSMATVSKSSNSNPEL